MKGPMNRNVCIGGGMMLALCVAFFASLIHSTYLMEGFAAAAGLAVLIIIVTSWAACGVFFLNRGVDQHIKERPTRRERGSNDTK